MDDFKEEGISHDIRELAYSKRLFYMDNMEANLLALETNLVANQFDVKWASDEQKLCELITKWLPDSAYNRVCVDADSVPDAFFDQGNLVQMSNIDDFISGNDSTNTLIVGADFAVVESGELVFLNRKLISCLNKVRNLIVVVNIDQVLVNHEDISLFSYIKEFYREYPSSITILQKPYDFIISDEFQSSNSAGYSAEKAKVHVILYVNNILPILGDVNLRDALYCVKCGHCSLVCPVSSAEHPVSPIDIVKSNCIDSQQGSRKMFQQTTLCGNCQHSCPVNIPLTDMMLYEMQISNRNDSFYKNKQLFSIFSKRSKMNKFNSRFLKSWFVRRFFGKNSVLKSYFSQQNSDFYNVLIQDSEEQDVQ